jgi:hypothetical protein
MKITVNARTVWSDPHLSVSDDSDNVIVIDNELLWDCSKFRQLQYRLKTEIKAARTRNGDRRIF